MPGLSLASFQRADGRDDPAQRVTDIPEVVGAAAKQAWEDQSGHCGRCGLALRERTHPEEDGVPVHLMSKTSGVGVELVCCDCEPDCTEGIAMPPDPFLDL